MSTQIRRAIGPDAFALAALAVQRGREQGAAPDRAFLARWADAWLADQPARVAWLATDEGVPVGALTARVAPGLPRLGEGECLVAAEVELYVSAPRRRCGIGARLAHEAIAWAREQGVEAVVDLAALGAAGPGIGRRLARSRVAAGTAVGATTPTSVSAGRRPAPAGTRG